MPKCPHGGRRPNQTGRPRHDNPKTEQIKARFTPDEAQRLDKQRKPNESRAACVRRLVMEIINEKEQEMNIGKFWTGRVVEDGNYYEMEEHEDGDITVDAPCGCYACTEQIQQGHFACDTPPEDMLAAEKEGEVWRSYVDGRWVWFTD
jgi:hypothetical protein